MTSKYDQYWQGRLPDLEQAVERAAAGEQVTVDAAGIQRLGSRSSWRGTATVRDADVLGVATAHMTALARTVAASGTCCRWPGVIFKFRITAAAELEISTDGPQAAQPDRADLSLHEMRPLPEHITSGLDRGRALDCTDSCREIHQLLETLPLLTDPDEVRTPSGLYFFYEAGEESPHAPAGRVVRIGNHPRSQGRLAARLGEHYRGGTNAKNGSVFRRYLGGALLRRDRPSSACLEPGPGLGHWEHQDHKACAECSYLEPAVTAHLRHACAFRCVRIDDPVLRNRLEEALIAALARCETCRPSPAWLGHFAYPDAVRTSGLWNYQHTAGTPIRADELLRFAELVTSTKTKPRGTSHIGRRFDDTLLLIPCSSSKQGTADLDLPPVRLSDRLSPHAAHVLQAGRDEASTRPGVSIDLESPLLAALSYYTGQPYATPGVRAGLAGAIRRGLHCLIISGAYGLVLAQEPIHRYQAHLPTQTRGVWQRRLGTILDDYVHGNGIRRCVITVSRSYATCLPASLCPDEQRIIPTFDRLTDTGSPMRVVPQRIGLALQVLLDNDLEDRATDRR